MRSLVSKELLEALQGRAPGDYNVVENILNIDVYQAGEEDELFETLYFPGDKAEDAAYILRILNGAINYDADNLVTHMDEPLTVREKLIDEHKKAAVISLDGQRSYIHYK